MCVRITEILEFEAEIMLQSPVDIAIVAGVILLIFGPKKVPELGKALGLGIGNFKRALFEAQDEVKTALKEDPAASAKQAQVVAQSTPAVGVGGGEKSPVERKEDTPA
jgi:sec-independent protein translocase protein TatA